VEAIFVLFAEKMLVTWKLSIRLWCGFTWFYKSKRSAYFTMAFRLENQNWWQ